jgi:hypothetical protein
MKGLEAGKFQVEIVVMSERSSSATKWGLGVIAGFVFYVLSAGPAQYLSMKYGSPKSAAWMPSFYAPARLLNYTPLGKPMNLWGAWWVKLALKDPEVVEKITGLKRGGE